MNEQLAKIRFLHTARSEMSLPSQKYLFDEENQTKSQDQYRIKSKETTKKNKNGFTCGFIVFDKLVKLLFLINQRAI